MNLNINNSTFIHDIYFGKRISPKYLIKIGLYLVTVSTCLISITFLHSRTDNIQTDKNAKSYRQQFNIKTVTPHRPINGGEGAGQDAGRAGDTGTLHAGT